MGRLERGHPPAHLPDLFDWTGEPWAPALPFTAGRTFRVEDYLQDGNYVLRAELPGVDPDEGAEVTVEGRTLTICAERREEHDEPHRCEFRYGSFTRSVTLPEGADTEHITARYDKGILEITVPVAEAAPAGRRIDITHA
jgi:HSP20 family molecular chaperone IbpA